MLFYYLTTTAALGGCPFRHLVTHGGETPHPQLVEPLMGRAKAAKLKADADAATSTVSGCKCSGQCGGTADDLGKCEWCYTEDGCGHRTLSSLGMSWDYCTYPKIESWEAKSATQKMSDTWAKVTADSSPGDFPFPSVPLNPGIFVESVRTTFDNQWDEMPAGRPKYIHAQGMVCKVDLKVTSTKYTGIFEPGTAQGILRIGSALPVTSITGIVPGIGMKFFRSGVQSANWVMLHSLAPQIGDTYDMFHYPQYNHIASPPIYAKALAEKFLQASGCIEMVGLSDVCEYNQAGQKAKNAKFPYKIEFRQAEASMPAGGCGQEELMTRMLDAGKAGVVLYTVYAYESPISDPIVLGTITVSKDSDCVSSKYGDEKLFIRHQRIEEDWAKRPEWIPHITDEECGGYSIADIMATSQPKCSDQTEAEGMFSCVENVFAE